MAGRDDQNRKQKRVEREQESERPEREREIEFPNRQETRPGRGISPTDPAEGPREDVETTNNPDEQNTGD